MCVLVMDLNASSQGTKMYAASLGWWALRHVQPCIRSGHIARQPDRVGDSDHEGPISADMRRSLPEDVPARLRPPSNGTESFVVAPARVGLAEATH